MRKRINYFVLAMLWLLCFLFFGNTGTANAAETLNASPNAKIEYGYSANVQVGTIRYVQQYSTSLKNTTYVYDGYWNGNYNNSIGECYCASVSMALSYIGINRTGGEILSGGRLHAQPGATVSYPSTVSAGVNNLINGNGKYSPVIIHWPVQTSSSFQHWVIVAGRVSGNTYLIVDPLRNSGLTTFQATIDDTAKTMTVGSKVYTIDSYMQYYNANAVFNVQLWGISNGDSFKGEAQFWAKRSDNDSNHYAIFYIDDIAITGHMSADSNGFFSVKNDTTKLTNGTHKLSIYYANTDAGCWDTRTININNDYYMFDINGYLDTYPSTLEGNGLPAGATADIYINGNKVADDVSDFYDNYVEGTRYEIKDIKCPNGIGYSRMLSGNLSGTISSTTQVWLFFVSYYTFDVNSYLDSYPSTLEGNGLPEGVTVDVYINGNLVANDVNDFVNDFPRGTTYEVKDIKCPSGISFSRMLKGTLSGSLTSETRIWLFFESCKHSSKVKTISSKYLKSAATCDKSAIYYYECADCHKKLTDTFSYGKALGHKENTVKTPATVSKDGSIVKSCLRCKKELSRTKINRAYVKCDKKVLYTGKDIKPVKIVDANGKAISSSNYTITYKNNTKVGKATATVTFKNNYSGTNNYSFEIVPKATSIVSLKATTKAFTVTWKKVSTDYTGYQIQYATSSNFKSGAKAVTVKSKTATSRTISNLKSGKNYYVRIRVYKTVSGKNYYSDWSDAKKVKVK